MPERTQVAENLPLDYEGIFSVSELYKAILGWMKENEYVNHELMHNETFDKKGKNISFRWEGTKKLSEFLDSIIALHVELTEIQEVTVEKGGKKLHLQKGKVDIKFHSYVYMDLEYAWETRPTYAIMKRIFDKFLYKPFTAGPEGRVRKDTNALYKRVDAFLNLYRY